jgi:hypothetical protein
MVDRRRSRREVGDSMGTGVTGGGEGERAMVSGGW